MATPKVYPGELVINQRWKKKQHFIAPYSKYGLELGIYSDSLDLIVKEMVKNLKNNYQNVVHFSGTPGAGKSTLAIQFLQKMAKARNVKLDLNTDYIYYADDLWEKLKKNPTPVFFFDEAGITLNALSYRGSDDKDIVGLIETMRSRGNTIALVSPILGNINSKVRKNYVDYVFECSSDKVPLKWGATNYTRGFFEFKERVPNSNPDKEPYWNLLTAGVFEELDPETDRIYQAIKKAHQNKLIERMIERNYRDDFKGEDAEA